MFQQAQRRRLDLAMSWINLGEVYYLLAKRHGGAHADQFLSDLALTPASARRAGRAYDDWCGAVADAFAVETARQAQGPLVTGDPELKALADRQPLVKLEWVGR